jgi:formate dehydrogenase alpha subunit
MKTVTLTIDGKTITASEGSTVLEAARSAGIQIPTLCYDERMEPYGACRLCIVEIEGMRGLPTSCTTTVAEGMVVRTETETVSQVRRMTCEMLIADHPSDCLACSSNQRCQLQKVASRLGITEKRLKPMERESVLDESNPFYTRDLAKCILCGLCVRVCDEVRGVTAIGIAGRGYESRIAAFGDDSVDHSTCESCGACVDICPVDALRAKHETLPPDKTVHTICPYCGCGCELEIGVRANKIVRVQGARECPVNWGQLCVKGRFGLDFVSAPDRLTKPLIKRNGEFEEASWDEALDLVASKLGEIKEKHGADAIAGFASAKCTNEENYVFQKMMRAAVGTNNVDHCARLCHASTVAGLSLAFGSGAMTNSIEEFEHADCIFVTGSNTTEAHPIIALRIKAAVERHGAQLLVADPRAIDLTRFASQHVRQRCGSDVALFNAMIHVIIGEGLADKDFIANRTEGFEELAKSVEHCTVEWAAAITGVDAEEIRKLARTYAKAKSASIVYSMGITQHTTGTDNVLAVANLAMLTGNIGRLSTGVNPLRGQNNVQGACDLGSLPNVYTGYQPVTAPDIQKKFEKAWGVPLSDKVGLPLTEAIHAAADGRLKGIYIMGENPMVSDPNLNHAREAIENLEFLCVQDIFMTETAQMADVVLPAVSFAEKDGTFTNTERRVQRVRKVLDPPGEARQDWDITSEIATRLGYEMHYDSAEEILAEIASVTPILAGITFDRIDKIGIPWPCPTTDHPGTPFLHEGEFKRGLGKFHPTLFREPAELPDDEYPLILTTGRVLYHFHTGTMTRRSPGLEEISPPTPFEINPTDAAELGIAEGDTAQLSSRRGVVRAQALVTERAPRGTVFMPFHFSEAAANTLTNDALDPVAKIPEFKVCAVRVDAVPQATPVTASAREDS